MQPAAAAVALTHAFAAIVTAPVPFSVAVDVLELVSARSVVAPRYATALGNSVGPLCFRQTGSKVNP